MATGYALWKRGHAATLEPGEELNLKLDYDLLMPAAVEPTAKAPPPSIQGLKIKVKKTKVVDDGLDGHMMRVDASIVNHSNRTLKSIDLFLEDANGNRCPITGGLEEDSEYLFDVEPQSARNVRMYFAVRWPKLKHKMVWLNHTNHKVAYEGALQ
jgi:hypothetical protein